MGVTNKKDVKQMMDLVHILENRYGSLLEVSEDDDELYKLRDMLNC